MTTPGQLKRRAQFFEQLATTIAAGLPLIKALELAAKTNASGIPRIVIQQIIAHLHNGHTFADAMKLISGQKFPGMEVDFKPRDSYWLSEFDLAMLYVGETTGRLDAAFKVLARYYAGRARIISETISGLAITAATLHVFLIIFPLRLLIEFVRGLVDNNFSECKPFIIEKLIVFGVLYGAVFFLIFACQGRRGEKWRLVVEFIFDGIPILRTALKYLAIARLSIALNSLLSAGVDVVKSWELAAAAAGSARLKRSINRWAPEFERGVTPGEMVSQIRYFPEVFTHLFVTGEMSGSQDETLERLYTYFEEEGSRKMRTFAVLTARMIYGLMVIVAVMFIFNFYLGYFSTLFKDN